MMSFYGIPQFYDAQVVNERPYFNTVYQKHCQVPTGTVREEGHPVHLSLDDPSG